MPDLRLENIVKKYGRQTAVDRLSLEVREGELLTLLGPSGCGRFLSPHCCSAARTTWSSSPAAVRLVGEPRPGARSW